MEHLLLEFSDWIYDASREMERECERMTEKVEQMNKYKKAFEIAQDLLSENEKLNDQFKTLQEENELLRQQLQEKEVQLSEQRKLTTGMAKKSSEDELIKAIRTFLNISKRKSLDKRVHVKIMIMELVDAANITLPPDLKETLARLDDELPEPKVVNVAGNYNDIHDNKKVEGVA